jgi:hypothetical protein
MQLNKLTIDAQLINVILKFEMGNKSKNINFKELTLLYERARRKD